ncbi:uncharacterized protein LOC143851386 [Tasmannia lanceolata]|uniref:uncharacterized protein LOC143851386 n=1 Tax=Tasmannia lanceolata TaxID=3420 RepID=UPI004062BEBC
MRTFMSLVLLLLLFLLVTVQGIRLEPASIFTKNHKFYKEERSSIEGNGNIGEVVICEDGNCSGRNRKLMDKASSTSENANREVEATPKNHSGDKFDRKQENFSVKSATSEHRQHTPERYPDIIDIAGMDYSPARRKPPIHN